jgi:hypothetical protein
MSLWDLIFLLKQMRRRGYWIDALEMIKSHHENTGTFVTEEIEITVRIKRRKMLP